VQGRNPESCYNCGTTENLTDDHIPPDGFFPPPKPTNLITVRCCRKCNEGFSLDDEAFRIWATSAHGISPEGKWIWKNKVLPNSLDKKPKLMANVAKSIRLAEIKTPAGPRKVALSTFPQDRAIRFVTRVTKGLIRRFYPELHNPQSHFRVIHLRPTEVVIACLKTMLPTLIEDSRGGTVFRFYRGIPRDAPDCSLWVYFFYDEVAFWVDQMPPKSVPVIL
jgi:hypothetical protein